MDKIQKWIIIQKWIKIQKSIKIQRWVKINGSKSKNGQKSKKRFRIQKFVENSKMDLNKKKSFFGTKSIILTQCEWVLMSLQKRLLVWLFVWTTGTYLQADAKGNGKLLSSNWAGHQFCYLQKCWKTDNYQLLIFFLHSSWIMRKMMNLSNLQNL